MSGAEKTTAERIAELKLERAKLDTAMKDERELAQLQGLELELRFRKELGKPGVDFAMVDVSEYGCGFVVMKLGEDLPFRTYIDAVATAESGVPDAADIFAFVGPCVVYPTKEDFAAIVRRRGFISNKCAEVLAELHGTRAKKVESK